MQLFYGCIRIEKFDASRLENGRCNNRMDANQEIFNKIMDDSDFKADVQNWLTKKIYARFRAAE